MLKRIDLAIVDPVPSDGDGAEFVREFCELNPGSVALVLTASPDPKQMERAAGYRTVEAAHKPAGVAKILDAAKRLGAVVSSRSSNRCGRSVLRGTLGFASEG